MIAFILSYPTFAILVGSLGVLITLVALWLRFNPQFGGSLTRKLRERYAESPQWNGQRFENELKTVMDLGPGKAIKLIREQHKNRKERKPKAPLAIIRFDEAAWNRHPESPTFIWYGHAVLLLRVGGKTLLIDPMLGPNAAPISPIGGASRFSENTLAIIDTLPPLDAILITHDHYDHLDLASIRRLKSKTEAWWVALGVGRHLERWGVAAEQITEVDWWQEISWEGGSATFTPSRHFSGRGLSDRQKSLWGGWVFRTPQHALYWTGDGGYGPHFEEVGKRLGPFDFGWVECGQYHPYWHAIHMYPEEAVRAAQDAHANIVTPMHWGGFALSPHTWKDPIQRFVAAATEEQQRYIIPKLGEVVHLHELPSTEAWWEK